MLTWWLTLTAFLAGSVITGRAASGRGAVTFAPACRVKAHPEVELTLNCGDRKSAGVVQYWHSPFGDLQSSGFHARLDPVWMQPDGSLVIPNASILHSGLYYCLLQDKAGITLWQYELHVDSNNQNHHNDDKYEQGSSCASARFRRSAGSPEEKQAGVSDGLFAGAVVASVLLTFVVGFSAGALSRTHVLRCFGAIAMRLQSSKRQADVPDHGSQITMTTMPSTYNKQASESESNFANLTLTSLFPPAKPQRSFRHKPGGEEEATAYLEGCDRVEEEKGDAAGGGVEEMKEEKEFNGVHMLEDEGNQTDTDEDTHSEDREEEDVDGTEGRMDEAESSSRENDDEVRREEDGEKTAEEVNEKATSGDVEQPSAETEDEKSSNNDITASSSSSAPIRGRRSRVIRLYQYDEDGQRFSHLPDPIPEDPSPAPKLKQRSISLTRLSAIMAAASAGPLDQKETDATESEEKLQFHMEI